MDYISELKKAEICEYGDQREEIICGMIIVWMTENVPMKTKLHEKKLRFPIHNSRRFNES